MTDQGVPRHRPRHRQQVAALCWRRAPDLQVLLVTSLRTRRWILPKGWPEANLTLAEAAAREALEEAGVSGVICAEPMGHYHYLKEKAGQALPCKVEIFCLHVTEQRSSWPEKDQREIVWMPVEQAARLAEKGLRPLLLNFGKNRAAA